MMTNWVTAYLFFFVPIFWGYKEQASLVGIFLISTASICRLTAVSNRIGQSRGAALALLIDGVSPAVLFSTEFIGNLQCI